MKLELIIEKPVAYRILLHISPSLWNLSQFKTVNAHSDHTVLQYTHLGVKKKENCISPAP